MVFSVSSWSLELRVVKLLFLANFEVSEPRA
jgi:hypothetical protein